MTITSTTHTHTHTHTHHHQTLIHTSILLDATRLEFPVGYARQDIYLGTPILPSELAALPLVEQKARVLAGMNGLGPDITLEIPNEPNIKFATAVAELIDAKALNEPQAVFLQTFSESPMLDGDLKLLCDHIRNDNPLPGVTETDAWLNMLADWFKT